MEITREQRQYDINALKANIAKIGDNIKIFEDAIQKEREEIKRLEQIIAVLEADQGAKNR